MRQFLLHSWTSEAALYHLSFYLHHSFVFSCHCPCSSCPPPAALMYIRLPFFLAAAVANYIPDAYTKTLNAKRVRIQPPMPQLLITPIMRQSAAAPIHKLHVKEEEVACEQYANNGTPSVARCFSLAPSNIINTS
jgi:hypothetical protein